MGRLWFRKCSWCVLKQRKPNFTRQSISLLSPQRLENVLLEEIGHWLDDVSLFDSPGDEGAIFASVLSGRMMPKASGNDISSVVIDGRIYRAEFNSAPVIEDAVVTVANRYLIHTLLKISMRRPLATILT